MERGRHTRDEGGTFDYDLAVIGTGSAGSAMAIRCARAGWRVAIADQGVYGGTCGLRGCVPKKVLHDAAETVVRARRQAGAGVACGSSAAECELAWADLARFREVFTGAVTPRREATLAGAGVAMLRGHARFAGPNALRVGDDLVTARFIGIATGSVPLPLGIPGEELVASSEDFLALESMPASILFIGGGFISLEFAFVAAVAGARVTVLHRSGRLLKGFDPFLVDLLVEACAELGITIETDAPVEAVERSGAGLRVRSGDRSYDAGMVVHGAGRIPNTAGLDLVAGGVAKDVRGIEVTPHLQSVSNPAVYVAGDANPRGRPLSPIARRDGLAVAENMLRGNTVAPVYDDVPSAVYTYPVLASVGLTHEAAERAGVPATVHRADTSDWFTSRRLNVPRSGYVVLTDGPEGRILGAHLLGHNADEVINLFALAMRHGITFEDLRATDYAYPTAVQDIKRMR